MKSLMACTMGVLVLAFPALAVELTGGSLGFSYSASTDDTDHTRLSFDGSAVIELGTSVDAQFDIGSDHFGEADLASQALGFHGVYQMSDTSRVGVFYTAEDVDSNGREIDVDLYGVELGQAFGKTDLEGYIGRADAGNADGAMLGLAGRFEMRNGIGLGGSFDYVDVKGFEAGKLALRLDSDVSDNLNLYVEIGSAKARAFGVADSEPYVGLGGKFVFGADRGALFDRRGLSRILPGL